MNMKIALCQMKVVENKGENINKAISMIERSVEKEADMIVLPEMFNCPYDNKYFRHYAEKINLKGDNRGETVQALVKAARDNKVYIIGGSIPEIDTEGRIYNTSIVINKQGEILDVHRKIHLFDIDVKGKIVFKESDVLTSGNTPTVVSTSLGEIGVMICYDIRFPELSRIMVEKGAKIIFTPAAFNMTTGPSHWETLFKCRALDNQVYMVGVSPARCNNSSYVAYGNSLVASPWGEIVGRLDEKEGILFQNIDLKYEEKVREELPLLKHIRRDLYTLKLL
ncbi:carbon-nitrogen hydrolase family protein [Clostridium niameyense]|uniref:Carbon-nitrogen hydrolase family protein n=2 Tax=Clostridium niameyense TaxID=1622073 RepID=A0A6M0R8W6_9CLOT|nr:carbon-nitrogen hydrolase family protein [Clostridium niameyense]NEZ46217.1 carbon-nitrogen hydrolase family protein [Clostridium niameyense]